MELEHLLLTVDDHVAVVTLNRPPVNAQNRRIREEPDPRLRRPWR